MLGKGFLRRTRSRRVGLQTVRVCLAHPTDVMGCRAFWYGVHRSPSQQRRCTIRIASGANDLANENASVGVPFIHVSKWSGEESSTGIRSWLMLAVSSFGSVVMNASTSCSTFSPFFLIGPR
jgi:hypothetical protein